MEKTMQNPKLIPVPFANSGIKDEIPKAKSTSMSDEKASWETGFPEATMLPVYAGGLPPDGKDFNGVLNQISENLVFQSKGGRYKFDPDFALSIGGYPKGATLQTNDESAEYQSLIDNNLVNFNTATPEEIAQSWRITGLGDATEVLNGKFDKASVKNELGLSQIEVVSQKVVTEMGSGVVGSFENGLNFIGELTSSDQQVTLENEFGKQPYYWGGDLPKPVPAGSTPQSTGGIGKGAWVSVGDASLRNDIKNGNGSDVGVSIGTLADAITYITPEMFFVAGELDSTQMIVRALDYALPRKLDVIGYKEYVISSQITIRQTANIPPKLKDFSITHLKLKKVTYTGNSGIAFSAESPVCSVQIGELLGTAKVSNFSQTTGIKLVGNGTAIHRIDRIGGFGTNVLFSESYGNTIEIGWCDDAFRGVRGVSSNANKVYGRIGGRFSTDVIIADSCDVGVEWDSTSNTNEVYANIEYCKRTANSRPIIDNGIANKFYGYIESCSLPLVISGTENNYSVMNGGNTTRGEYGAIVGGRNNKLEILRAKTLDGVDVTEANSTITFDNFQAIQSVNNSSSVAGVGHNELLSSTVVNQLLSSSNDLSSSIWTKQGLGSADINNVTFAFNRYNNSQSNGYVFGTKITIPTAANSESDIYTIGQAVTTTFTKDVSQGIAVQVIDGDVDISIKTQGETSKKIYKKSIRLTSGSKIIELSHCVPSVYVSEEKVFFQIQLRAWKPSQLVVFNTHLCSAAGITRAPASIGTGVTPFTPFYSQGTKSKNSISKPITSPITLYQYDFDTYLISAITGNVTLAKGVDGLKVTFFKTGDSETNLISSDTINGASSYPMQSRFKHVTLVWSDFMGMWIIV